MDANGSTVVDLGWLWFDNNPKTSLEDKVAQATLRYRQKFGQPPSLCYVHPQTLDGSPTRCGQIQVHSAGYVLPGHFLFVVDGELTKN